MADTKLSRTKVPNMKGKPKKLGLLSSGNRQMVAFKLDPITVQKLGELVNEYKQSYFHSLSKTDILEVALKHFLGKTQERHIALLIKYGRKDKNV